MKFKNIFLKSTFYILFILYILIFIGYQFWISIFHSSFNLISLTAVLFPFAFLLIYQWLMWKYQISKIKGKEKSVFKVIIILGIIPPLYSLIILGLNEYNNHFTVEKWMKSPEKRVYMVDDLLTKYKLTGKSKNEVEMLLGKATQDAYFKEYDNIVYHLGFERGLISIDSEWLVISFNGSGKVGKVKVITD